MNKHIIQAKEKLRSKLESIITQHSKYYFQSLSERILAGKGSYDYASIIGITNAKSKAFINGLTYRWFRKNQVLFL